MRWHAAQPLRRARRGRRSPWSQVFPQGRVIGLAVRGSGAAWAAAGARSRVRRRPRRTRLRRSPARRDKSATIASASRSPSSAATRARASGSTGSTCVCAVVDVLQRVLEVAQEFIAGREPVVLVSRGSEPSSARQASVASVERERRPRLAPAADHLEGLREELDLAYAAAAELDVVVAVIASGVAAAGLGADQCVQVAQRGDRAEVEVLAEHEGPHDVLERAALRGELRRTWRTPAPTRPGPSATRSAPTRAPAPPGTPRASRSTPPAAPSRRSGRSRMSTRNTKPSLRDVRRARR